MIDYNVDLLNRNDLPHSFFCTNRDDPTVGFAYDASQAFGPVFPDAPTTEGSFEDSVLRQRLILGSHLAQHLRHKLEEELGYTATVGISTNKLLSKLVGNVHKPKNQTTLVPPYEPSPVNEGNPILFMDDHDIGKVPGIGFKLAQKVRALVLGRPAVFQKGLVYGGTRENVTVRDVRTSPGISPKLLEETLTGPGSQKGIGGIVYDLLHGIDDTEVARAKKVPSQISIEDSYIRLDTIEEVRKELLMLSRSLLKRMHLDLTEEDDFAEGEETEITTQGQRRWLAHPRTLRLSTRPRPPLNPDGSRPRIFNRISRSCPMPNFAFNLHETVESLAEKLVNETLMSSFRKLHPERSGWNLSLVNVAVTNMAETAADSKYSDGRDIGRMFRRQDDVLKDWKVVDGDDNSTVQQEDGRLERGMNSVIVGPIRRPEQDQALAMEANDRDHTTIQGDVQSTEEWHDGEWVEDEYNSDGVMSCQICSASLPAFAMVAHLRYHGAPD